MERLRPFRACRADDKVARGAHDETGDDETGAHDETGEQAARRSDGTPAREVGSLRAPSVDRVELANVLGKTAGGGTAAGSTAGGTALLTSRHRPRVTKPPPAAISGSISSISAISASSAAISLSSLLDYSTDYGVGYLAWLGLGLGLVTTLTLTLTLALTSHLSPSPSP